MSEEQFYKICDAAEAIDENVTENYFPSPKEIASNIEAYGLDAQVDLLAYYASNPFKRIGNPLAEDCDYLETVNYCRKKLGEVVLAETL